MWLWLALQGHRTMWILLYLCKYKTFEGVEIYAWIVFWGNFPLVFITIEKKNLFLRSWNCETRWVVVTCTNKLFTWTHSKHKQIKRKHIFGLHSSSSNTVFGKAEFKYRRIDECSGKAPQGSLKPAVSTNTMLKRWREDNMVLVAQLCMCAQSKVSVEHQDLLLQHLSSWLALAIPVL